MAIYGSEFVTARTCVEQIIDLHTMFQYLGVPVCEKSYMSGDNQSVVKSSTILEAKLHKHHIALSFHCVQETIESIYIVFAFLSGSENHVDILSKHWSHTAIWDQLRPFLFCYGFSLNEASKEMSA